MDELKRKENDSFLMEKLKPADMAAWEAIVSSYSSFVYALSKKILTSDADAQDNTQDVFLRLFKYANKYDEESGSLKGWIGKITCREALRKLNQSKKRTQKENHVSESIEMPRASIEVETNLDAKETLYCLKNAIEQLPENLRVPLVMYYSGSLSQAEIAKELRLSQFSISTRIKSAISSLKNMLKKSGFAASIILTNVILKQAILEESTPQNLQAEVISMLRENQDVNSVLPVIKNSSGIYKYFLMGIASMAMVLGTFYLSFGQIEELVKAKEQTVDIQSDNYDWKNISTKNTFHLSFTNPYVKGVAKNEKAKVRFEDSNAWRFEKSSFICIPPKKLQGEGDRLQITITENIFSDNIRLKGDFIVAKEKKHSLVGFVYLHNFDKDISKFGGFDTIASYINLLPGNYSFEIEISLKDKNNRVCITKFFKENVFLSDWQKDVPIQSGKYQFGFFTESNIEFKNIKYAIVDN